MLFAIFLILSLLSTAMGAFISGYYFALRNKDHLK